MKFAKNRAYDRTYRSKLHVMVLNKFCSLNLIFNIIFFHLIFVIKSVGNFVFVKIFI